MNAPVVVVQRRSRREIGAIVWMAVLILSICFEGVGRKFLPMVPSQVFYFLKDVVVLGGFAIYGLPDSVLQTARVLFRGFGIFLVVSIVWTALEMANPDQNSIVLGLVGMRAYWLWWLAPLVVASALERAGRRSDMLVVLSVVAMVVSAFALLQFTLPSTDVLNMNALQNGEERADVVTIASTGRVRVSSTFSFTTGLCDFCAILLPTLLAYGLEARSRTVRLATLVGAGLTLLVTPLTGSRGAVMLVFGSTFIVLLATGFLSTRRGWVVVGLAAAALGAAVLTTPDALQGLSDRFEGSDTSARFLEPLQVLPPVAMAITDYPAFGVGTGMQQNARFSLDAPITMYDSEAEQGRFLVELGIPGSWLLFALRIGLCVALVRGARMLQRRGRRGEAGALYALLVPVVSGNLVFDHVFQALLFLAFGVGLHAVHRARMGLPAVT